MKRMLALLIVLSLLLPAVALAQDKQVVTFDDPVLEAVIRGLVRVPEGDVTADKLAKLTALGVKVDGCLPVITQPNKHSIGYIKTKRQRMGHAVPDWAADEAPKKPDLNAA